MIFFKIKILWFIVIWILSKLFYHVKCFWNIVFMSWWWWDKVIVFVLHQVGSGVRKHLQMSHYGCCLRCDKKIINQCNTIEHSQKSHMVNYKYPVMVQAHFYTFISIVFLWSHISQYQTALIGFDSRWFWKFFTFNINLWSVSHLIVFLKICGFNVLFFICHSIALLIPIPNIGQN